MQPQRHVPTWLASLQIAALVLGAWLLAHVLVTGCAAVFGSWGELVAVPLFLAAVAAAVQLLRS